MVDDGSPDGTAEIVDKLHETDPHISVFRRTKKEGLGRAYIAAFRHVLPQGYEAVICMDADFSHDPTVLPKMVEALKDHDFVIGARYIPGGATPDWKLSRRLISRTGNLIARTLLWCPIHDCTTGYRGYRREALEKLDFDSIKLSGYGFMIETAYKNYLNGMRIKEVPIVFLDRRVGKSKMSGAIVQEALFYVIKLRAKRIWEQITGQAKTPANKPGTVD